MSAGSLFPDRPIRPLPKRRLRERLSPEAAGVIQYPPAPQSVAPLFPYPYSNLRDEKSDPSFGLSRDRAGEVDLRQPRRNGLGPDNEQAESTEVRRGLGGRDTPESSGRQPRSTKHDQGRNYKPPLSATSSVDGYDSFENTNNKKKRKVPSAGDSALNGVLVVNDTISSDSGSLTTADQSVDGNRDASSTSSATTYGSPNFATGGQNVPGPGRGRYGRPRSGRSPLRPLTDSTNNWAGRNARLRSAQWTPGSSENTGIISNAIANAEKLLPHQGQENMSLLHQQLSNKRNTPSTQFTFTCDAKVPGSIAWPGSPNLMTMPTHHAPSARQATENWARNPQATQTSQASAAPPAVGTSPKELPTQAGPAGQHQAGAPPKTTRKSLMKEYAAAAKARRRETQLYNKRHPPKPEEVWICHFCEYEMIFGRPPEALIRQYEAKDRKQRLQEQQRKAQWERLKKGKHKGKKSSNLPPKSNDVAHDAQHAAGAHDAPMNSNYSQGTQSEEYDDDDDYEDEDYEPDEDIPPGSELPVSVQRDNVVAQPVHNPALQAAGT
ncbi:hypothetical protein B0H66DRAFT_598423 [Apodospora peruviana]|uniref:Uncharacterized protein n=1 Tax=Apodospora peruviana TaxID=516989 RepID=A0AAE0ITK7_9PEZI|nr:hypothetical protein B0H66DRAFT_598423 [Apodospora peruviana]